GASRTARRATSARAAACATTPSSHAASRNRWNRVARAISCAPDTARWSSRGSRRSPGTCVRQSAHAARPQSAAPAASTVPRRMRVAVISDIHGNLHALEAVLQDVDAQRVDVTWCLGDLVGYGPRPNRCCALAAERAAICLAGNHDLAVRGDIDLEEFAGDAAAAAAWTRGVLDDDSRSFLAGLAPSARAEGVELYHGSPRDPVW